MSINPTNKPVSRAYLLYSFGFGLSLFLVIFYSGVKDWPIWQTVVMGSFVQFLYSMSKRMWRNQFGRNIRTEYGQSTAKLKLGSSIVVGYSGAFVICGLWYCLGRMAM